MPSESNLAIHVTGQVTADSQPAFFQATRENAANSILESGVARFDVLRGVDQPDRFCLLEVYRDESGPLSHKQTPHYNAWREGVADMMAQPRRAKTYHTLFPPKPHWGTEQSAHISSNSDSSIDWGELGELKDLMVVLVDVQVKPGTSPNFIEATLRNCRESLREPGISRFDLLQGVEDQNNFVLVEVYNNELGPTQHKATAHYLRWRAEVEDMMARPREASQYWAQYPSRVHWHRAEPVTHATAISPPGSIQTFEFVSPARIIFGKGAAAKLPELVKELGGKKALVITGQGGDQRHSKLLQTLGPFVSFAVSGEPSVEDVEEATDYARTQDCDIVVGLGGGSVVDAGKAVACLLTNTGTVLDYLEVIGRGQTIQNPSAPYIAVPTTAGTGSEVTKNAVIRSSQHKLKASMRSPHMLPSIALVDPLLTLSTPPQVTAHTGLDALCQCIEPYISNKANPITDALAKEGITRAVRSLRAVYRDGNDVAAREDLAMASLLGGLALANAKLGAVHGFAGVLGGMYPTASHGALCAALLPPVFLANVIALRRSSSGDSAEALERCVEVARLVTGNPSATVEQGAAWLSALATDLQVSSLSEMGVDEADYEEIVSQSERSSSMAGNPVKLDTMALISILVQAA